MDRRGWRFFPTVPNFCKTSTESSKSSSVIGTFTVDVHRELSSERVSSRDSTAARIARLTRSAAARRTHCAASARTRIGVCVIIRHRALSLGTGLSDGISLGSIPKGTPLDVVDPNRSLCRGFDVLFAVVVIIVVAVVVGVCFFRETETAAAEPPRLFATTPGAAAATGLRNITPAPSSPSIIAAAAAAAAAAASAVRLSFALALANAPATNVARNAAVNAKCVRYPSVSRPNTARATASISSRRTRRVTTPPSASVVVSVVSVVVVPGRLKWFLTHRQYIRPSSPRSVVNAASVARIASTRARSIV